MHRDGTGVREGGVVPHLREQILAREDRAGAAGEDEEQVELRGGERHGLTITGGAAGVGIDREAAAGVGRAAWVSAEEGSATQEGLDAGDEEGGRTGLLT